MVIWSVVNQQEQPPSVEISRVKTSDKKESGKETFKRVKSWPLTELRLVDGHRVDGEGPEFDLAFDRQTFRWIASNVADKKAFVTQLYKVRYSLCPLAQILPSPFKRGEAKFSLPLPCQKKTRT